MSDKLFTDAALLDIYGALLTEKQREILDGFLNEGLTVSELAAGHAITRQAVSDLIRRSVGLLYGYDEKLRLHAKYESNVGLCDEIIGELVRDGVSGGVLGKLSLLRSEL